MRFVYLVFFGQHNLHLRLKFVRCTSLNLTMEPEEEQEQQKHGAKEKQRNAGRIIFIRSEIVFIYLCLNAL